MTRRDEINWQITVLLRVLSFLLTAVLGLTASLATSFVHAQWWLFGLSAAGLVVVACATIGVSTRLKRRIREIRDHD